MSHEEDELVGSRPSRPGEDPRFDDADVYVTDNGATQQIEDTDPFDPLDVDESPYLPAITDDDGSPGFRPAADAAQAFEKSVETDNRAEESGDDVLGDEFQDRLRQREDASVDAVGAPVSDLVQLAQVGRMRQEEQIARAPYVRINPESAARALLGSQVSMTTNDSPKQVAVWSAESDAETTDVTIQFLPVVLGLASAAVKNATVLRPYGIINFGTRGIYQVEVDIGLGVQLSLNASEVSLQVALETPPSGTVATAIQLAGMISFLPCVRTAPVTRTRYIDALVDTGTASAIIPAFAKNFVFWRASRATSATITVQDSLTGTVTTFLLAANADMTVPVVLSGDARVITVLNTTGGGTAMASGRLIFELGI